MARRHPQPFWRSAKRCWYVQLGKKQIRLAPERDEAFRRYHELMAGGREEAEAKVAPPEPPRLVLEILDAFLDWCQRNRAKRTYEHNKEVLEKFAARVPTLLEVEQLKPWHVTKAMMDFDWADNTKANFIGAIKRAFNWAVEEEIIDRNPLDRMKKPGREAREMAISPAEYAKIIGAVSEEAFRDLLEVAWETGARPQELRQFEARHVELYRQWDEQEKREKLLGRIVMPPSQAKGKKYFRVVYLTERAASILSRLVEERPEGALLRNSEGNAWTKDSINCAFCRLQKKVRKKYHLGAFRKGFATEGLKNGVDTVTLAHLMGHRDPSMVSKVYGHVQKDPRHMAEAAQRARAGGASASAKPEGASAPRREPADEPDTPESPLRESG